MFRENENPAYFSLVFNILGQKLTSMRRFRGLTEDLIKEFISEVGIRVELSECLAILKAVHTVISVTHTIFKRGKNTYNKRIFLFKIEDILAAYFSIKYTIY